MTAPKRGPGRPPKPDRDRRAHQVQVRFTAPELRELERRAAADGQTVSEYVRSALGIEAPAQVR